MSGELQPLASNFQVVDANGFPTQYFIKWAQQRQIDITNGITAAQAQQLIDDWAAARQIIAGMGLTGGGYLSSDVTIDADASVILDLIDDTQGVILYRGASGWEALAPDTAGKVLTTGGAGADPTWATPAAGNLIGRTYIANDSGFAVTNNNFNPHSWSSGNIVSDSLGTWSSGNPTRFTAPTGTTYARITSITGWNGNQRGRRWDGLRKNGSVEQRGWTQYSPYGSAVKSAAFSRDYIGPASAGDYFEIVYAQDSGSPLNTIYVWVMIEWLSA